MSRHIHPLTVPGLAGAEVNHNGDWSGEVVISWTTIDGARHEAGFPAEIIPLFVLSLFDHKPWFMRGGMLDWFGGVHCREPVRVPMTGNPGYRCPKWKDGRRCIRLAHFDHEDCDFGPEPERKE